MIKWFLRSIELDLENRQLEGLREALEETVNDDFDLDDTNVRVKLQLIMDIIFKLL